MIADTWERAHPCAPGFLRWPIGKSLARKGARAPRESAIRNHYVSNRFKHYSHR